MRSRLFLRRLTATGGIYGAAVLGFLGTVLAFRLLGAEDFGRFALVVAAVGFVQVLVDLTVEEAVVKFGFRYIAAEDWGRLRRLFRIAYLFKGAGAAVGTAGVLLLAAVSEPVFGDDRLLVPLLLAALLPLVQMPEGLGAAALVLRERYDLRGVFLALSMGLRLAGIAVGSLGGLVGVVVGLLAAQAVATVAISAAGWAAFARFPAAAREPLGDDAPGFRRFVIQSSVGTGLVSGRTALAPVVLGVVAAPLQVGWFRLAQAPQVAFASLSAPVRLILLTEQTRDFERGRTDLLWRSLRRYGIGSTLLMAAVVPPLLWLMPDLVSLVYGAEALPAVDAARLILLAAAVQLVWGWSKSFPVSIGRPGLRILAQGVEIAVLVPLLVVFGLRWGATGAAGAVLVSTLAFAATWAVLLLRLVRDPGRLAGPAETVRP